MENNSHGPEPVSNTPDNASSDPKIRDGVTDFGFVEVPVERKQEKVRDVFASVAGSYDLMNDLMSLGVHRIWKAALMDWLAPRPSQALLDVAGGTGDIARLWRSRGGGPVTVCDINPEMLAVGVERLEKDGGDDGISFIEGNAEELPFPDKSFDRVTIAFGLRNVTRIDKALADMRRVLKPGGRFMCLEFSRPTQPWLDPIYDTYSFKVLPRIGQIVAKDREAYQYLVESIRKFPDQAELQRRMEAVGFERVAVRNLSAGIAAIHSGWRL
jgi:demethylmenaquinone methyltransferase/2-methoxy-6-polyprenyl-1,4-benzoquinol methylase